MTVPIDGATDGPMDAPTNAPVGDEESICVGCGMCCDGTLFRSVRLRDGDDPAALEAVGIRFTSRVAGPLTFEQPCVAFGDGRCGVYESRPGACRAYTCAVYRRHEAGEMTTDAAKALISATLELRDQLGPALAPHLSGDEARVLNELYRLLRAKFDPTSVFVRSLGPTSGADEPEGDVTDLIPLGDLEIRMPELNVSGTPAELSERRASLLQHHHDLGASAAPAEQLVVLEGLVAVHHTLGDASGAKRFGSDLLSVRRGMLGDDHPLTLTTREAVATWTGLDGRPLKALRLHTELLSDRARVFGPDHPDTLASRHDVADWTGICGAPEEAGPMLAELLPTQVRELGPDHRLTLATRHSLAYWTGALDHRRDALGQYEALLADYVRVLGPDDPAALKTRASMAYWTGALGDPTAAMELTAELLFDLARLLGADHPECRAAARVVMHWRRRSETAEAAESGLTPSA